jgi:hypothetical protein
MSIKKKQIRDAEAVFDELIGSVSRMRPGKINKLFDEIPIKDSRPPYRKVMAIAEKGANKRLGTCGDIRANARKFWWPMSRVEAKPVMECQMTVTRRLSNCGCVPGPHFKMVIVTEEKAQARQPEPVSFSGRLYQPNIGGKYFLGLNKR